MSYSQYQTVQASDFNTLASANLNVVWSTGSGSLGYGQTAVSNVTVGSNIAAAKWASLINDTANAAIHQGTSITTVTPPSTGNTVTYLSAIPSNLTTIYNNRFNAILQGANVANANVYNSTWANAITFAHTVSFANGDAARYFFNSGGQIKVATSHSPTTTALDTVFHNLTANVGTVVISAPTSGNATITGNVFTGITQVGGGGNAPTILPNNGYYSLTTSNAAVFSQVSTGAPINYTGSYIEVMTASNGTQGSNSDAGNIISIYTTWAEAPSTGQTVSPGATTTVTAIAPETTNISNSWGAITITSTASGS